MGGLDANRGGMAFHVCNYPSITVVFPFMGEFMEWAGLPERQLWI